MEKLVPVLFYSMFALLILWFYLANKLFGLLKTYHPIKYFEMGDPTLFLNNSSKTGFAFLSFLLFKKEWKELNDPRIISICKVMLIILYIYIPVFIGLLISIPFLKS